MDDGDRREYSRHDQDHDERGGIEESHRRLHALCAKWHYARKALRLHLPRANSLSHYTLDTLTATLVITG